MIQHSLVEIKQDFAGIYWNWHVWLVSTTLHNVKFHGHAIAVAVSCWTRAADAWIWSQPSACGICGGRSGTGTGYFVSTSVLPCHYHFTSPPDLLIYLSSTLLSWPLMESFNITPKNSTYQQMVTFHSHHCEYLRFHISIAWAGWLYDHIA